MKKASALLLFASIALFIVSCNRNIDNTGTGESAPTIYTPVIVTTDPSAISSVSAAAGGTLIDSGYGHITARGICYSTSHNPTTADNIVSVTSNVTNFVCQMTGLTRNVTYFIRAFATNSAGTGYGNERSVFAKLVLGESIGGGIVYFITVGNDTAFVVSPTDLPKVAWGCKGLLIDTTTRTGSAKGLLNTIDIANNCSSSAANTAHTYNQGGNNDWYLPSVDELNRLYDNRRNVGNLSSGYYWSSTSDDPDHAYYQNFTDGTPYVIDRNTLAKVRPIRFFKLY